MKPGPFLRPKERQKERGSACQFRQVGAFFYLKTGAGKTATTNILSFHKMEDMNGLLLRVPENDVFMSSMAAFGATGTPMPMGDIYSALQTGVIDGAENAAPVLYSMKHYEVAKYFSLTEHIRTPDVLIMSKSYLESLPKEIQDAVWEAGAYLEEVERQNWADYNDKCLEELEMGGTVINEVADKSDFVKASETVWEKFKDVVGEDMIDLCVSLQ